MKKNILLLCSLTCLFAFGLSAEDVVPAEVTAQPQQIEHVETEKTVGDHALNNDETDQLQDDSMLGKCPCKDKDKKKDKQEAFAGKCKHGGGCGCGKNIVIAKCPCQNDDKKKNKDSLFSVACKDFAIACECPEEEEEVVPAITEAQVA